MVYKDNLINPVIYIDISREIALEYMDDPDLVIISGTNNIGWFTEDRVNKQNHSLYNDVKIVQVRSDDDGIGIPITIEEEVVVNRYGDMIVSKETYDIIINNKNGYWYMPNSKDIDIYSLAVIDYYNGDEDYDNTSTNL